MHRLACAKESLPRCFRDLFSKGSRTTAAIERVVAIPEWPPVGVVFAGDGTDIKRRIHGVRFSAA